MRNWFDSAKDRNYWRSLVNAASNFRFSKAMELVNNLFSKCNNIVISLELKKKNYLTCKWVVIFFNLVRSLHAGKLSVTITLVSKTCGWDV
jgi:hypothetical protein